MGAIDNDWLEPLNGEFKKPYYRELYQKVRKEYETTQVFPDPMTYSMRFSLPPFPRLRW